LCHSVGHGDASQERPVVAGFFREHFSSRNCRFEPDFPEDYCLDEGIEEVCRFFAAEGIGMCKDRDQELTQPGTTDTRVALHELDISISKHFSHS
jgi:hypothetical protein